MSALNASAISSNEEGRKFSWVKLVEKELASLQPPTLKSLLIDLSWSSEWDFMDLC